MPGLKHGAKTDESDFEFALEDMTDKSPPPAFRVIQGRVLDDPVRHKTVGSGTAAKTIGLCTHSRLITHPCATCEFEAPRLLEAGRG